MLAKIALDEIEKGALRVYPHASPQTRRRDLHFHDLRGTAATRFYTAGLSERVIAEIMGWEEAYVARIIRRYVGRAAATRAIIAQLQQAKRGT